MTLTAFPSLPPLAIITQNSQDPVATPRPRPTTAIRRITLDPFPPGAPLTKLLFIPGAAASFASAVSAKSAASAFPTAGTVPIQRAAVSENREPRNPIPFTIGDDLCFGTENPRMKKRATPDNTNDDEAPLKTNLINYIQYVISRFDGDRCPSKALLQPPVFNSSSANEDGQRQEDRPRKRSAPLTKRQPRTIAELVELVVNIYNGCPTEGYRTKRAFRPSDLDAYTNLLPQPHESED